MKKISYRHFNTQASFYTKLYSKKKLNNFYPANQIRFNIIKKLLIKYKPKKIVDAGCDPVFHL